MFPHSARVGVAVSGGADSVFLLHTLRELAPRWNLQLAVVHIDHGIRGAASIADAEFVRELAAGFGLPFYVHRANALAADDNLEQAGRNIRHRFYRELLEKKTVDRISTGHTRNDQAETVLYRLLRGSGLAGLAGILPVTDEGLVRPLLEIDRAEIEDWLRARNIAWREDETNRDRAFARNRLRHEILPLVREGFNPQVDQALANLATLARDEEEYWAGALPAAPEKEPLIVPASYFASQPTAVARRLIRKTIESAKGNLRQVDFAHVERILEMTRSEEGHDRAQIPGLDVFRSFEWIRFARPEFESGKDRDFCLQLEAPGSVELPGATARITLQVLENPALREACGTVVNELDWQRLTLEGGVVSGLELRNWRPGDQYRRAGHSKQQSIKVLFQESRVPLWERRKWPIITYNGTILWARRFGAAAEFAAGPETRIVLRVAESICSAK